MNYYNEFDQGAAEWLRQLISAGCIPPGIVDTRSITEVMPGDLRGFTQCHFFAGIGGWSLALALAGWRTDEPVWTGSCPCQPYSVAGVGDGDNDPRALWWAFRWLISQCYPTTVFGEQVASKDGRLWLDGVRVDLEALGYGFGAADLCAAGIGAPHIRQRLYWLADSECTKRGEIGRPGQNECYRTENRGGQRAGRPSICSASSGLGHADGTGSQGRSTVSECRDEWAFGETGLGSWGDNWIPCLDGKARRIEPGITPLVDGLPGRVGLIRGYGNGIVPPLAAEFIAACMEVLA